MFPCRRLHVLPPGDVKPSRPLRLTPSELYVFSYGRYSQGRISRGNPILSAIYIRYRIRFYECLPRDP